MVEVKTIPYLERFPEFLTKYGDVRYESLNSTDNEKRFRIVVGDIEFEYNVFTRDDKSYISYGKSLIEKLLGRDTEVNCTVTLPGHNNGEPMALSAAYKANGSLVRSDVWGEHEGIPFP